MSNGPLRIEQYETVRYDINCNPLGVPDSVTRAIMENISAVGRYPDTYYDPLRNAIASYACCAPEHLVLGSGSSESAASLCCTSCTKEGFTADPISHGL